MSAGKLRNRWLKINRQLNRGDQSHGKGGVRNGGKMINAIQLTGLHGYFLTTKDRIASSYVVFLIYKITATNSIELTDSYLAKTFML